MNNYEVGTKVFEVSDCEFQIIVTCLKHIFINQNRNHYSQHMFANEFVYSCSIKICASGFSELLESTFCLLLVEAFFLQKVVEMLEDMVVSW